MDATDEQLNGAPGTPTLSTIADIPQRPAAIGGTMRAASSNRVLMWWLALVVLLVLAHVVTLEVQK